MATFPTVTDAASAEAFVRWCGRSIGMGYHPDTRGEDYADADGEPTFDAADARLFDEQHAAAFALLGDRVYDIGLDQIRQEIGADLQDDRSTGFPTWGYGR